MITLDNDTIVCECLNTPYSEIKEAIDNGCKSVPCIEEKTEAGSACRQCRSMDEDRQFRRKYHIQEDILDEM
ncbi:MAG: (2Fe-2S)-binding protein [Campylobacterales bacterium]|nr:(2Fe-2S)-binding protein [Campylobacterales bacterium]